MLCDDGETLRMVPWGHLGSRELASGRMALYDKRWATPRFGFQDPAKAIFEALVFCRLLHCARPAPFPRGFRRL